MRCVVAAPFGKVGIVTDNPARFAAFVILYGRVAEYVDDVRQQGVADNAVHCGGDFVDCDIGELFEHGVAVALWRALEDVEVGVLGGGVGDALGIAVRRVEHIIGVALDGFGDCGVGVGVDGECVGKYHFRECCRYVGNCDACKPLKRGGSRPFDGDFVVTLHSLVSGTGRIVECVITVDCHIRAVCGGCVFVENNIRGVGEHYGIEGVAEVVDCGVLESAEYFGAVVGDFQHLAEFERSDFVRDIVEAVDAYAGNDLNCLVGGADVRADVVAGVGDAVLFLFETGVFVDDGAVGQTEHGDGFRDLGLAFGGGIEETGVVDDDGTRGHAVRKRNG